VAPARRMTHPAEPRIRLMPSLPVPMPPPDASDDSPYFTLTVAQAAERTGMSPATVRQAIRAGRLPAVKFREGWHLRPRDVDAFKAGVLSGREDTRSMAVGATPVAPAKAWVVYRRALKDDLFGAIGVCTEAEWAAIRRAAEGVLTLIRGGLPSEQEAERVARLETAAHPAHGGRGTRVGSWAALDTRPREGNEE
jgi:excisionase family DNA binding protein